MTDHEKSPCPGLEVEPTIFSGCDGGPDCPTCDGTGEMINCPSCGGPLTNDVTCTQCETVWMEV